MVGIDGLFGVGIGVGVVTSDIRVGTGLRVGNFSFNSGFVLLRLLVAVKPKSLTSISLYLPSTFPNSFQHLGFLGAFSCLGGFRGDHFISISEGGSFLVFLFLAGVLAIGLGEFFGWDCTAVGLGVGGGGDCSAWSLSSSIWLAWAAHCSAWHFLAWFPRLGNVNILLDTGLEIGLGMYLATGHIIVWHCLVCMALLTLQLGLSWCSARPLSCSAWSSLLILWWRLSLGSSWKWG